MLLNIKTTFSILRPLASSVPTTFAWDPQSRLQSSLAPGVSINPGLERYNLPQHYDFHHWEDGDILAPLYR